jgi:hypothetical protein
MSEDTAFYLFCGGVFVVSVAAMVIVAVFV